MAVESRFVVIRQGVEVQTFMDKKGADEYDKMLDVADSLAVMFEQAPVELSETVIEELSVYLAQHRDQVLVALQAKKAKPEPTKPEAAKAIVADSVADSVQAESAKTAGAKTAGAETAGAKTAGAKTAGAKVNAPAKAKKSAPVADAATNAK